MLALYPGGIWYRGNCHKSTEEHHCCAKVTQLICNQQWVLWNVRYYRMYKHRSHMEIAYLVPWVRNWPLQNFHQQRNRLSFNSVSCHNISPWLNYSKNSYIIFWHFLWQQNQRLAWTRKNPSWDEGPTQDMFIVLINSVLLAKKAPVWGQGIRKMKTRKQSVADLVRTRLASWIFLPEPLTMFHIMTLQIQVITIGGLLILNCWAIIKLAQYISNWAESCIRWCHRVVLVK